MVVVDAELLLPVALCSLADVAACCLSFVDSPILIGGDVVSLPESLFPCAVSRLNTVLPVVGCTTRSGIFRFSGRRRGAVFTPDRKSTRLNSSHVKISYAVFCLKKKQR